jgi:hypothetical protein
MRVELVTDSGKPVGGKDLPDDVFKAFQQVTKWMYEQEIRELGTLCCLSVSPRHGYRARLPR